MSDELKNEVIRRVNSFQFTIEPMLVKDQSIENILEAIVMQLKAMRKFDDEIQDIQTQKSIGQLMYDIIIRWKSINNIKDTNASLFTQIERTLKNNTELAIKKFEPSPFKLSLPTKTTTVKPAPTFQPQPAPTQQQQLKPQLVQPTREEQEMQTTLKNYIKPEEIPWTFLNDQERIQFQDYLKGIITEVAKFFPSRSPDSIAVDVQTFVLKLPSTQNQKIFFGETLQTAINNIHLSSQAEQGAKKKYDISEPLQEFISKRLKTFEDAIVTRFNNRGTISSLLQDLLLDLKGSQFRNDVKTSAQIYSIKPFIFDTIKQFKGLIKEPTLDGRIQMDINDYIKP